MDVLFADELISSLALSPNFLQNGLCFAGSQRGLLVSNDGGQRWEDALEPLGLENEISITCVLCAEKPGKPPVVLAGSIGGILRSEDGGQSWVFQPLPSPAPTLSALAAAPDGTLYAGTAEDGIFVSQDGGTNWSRWNFGLLDKHIFSLAVAAGPRPEDLRSEGPQPLILAGTETGVFYSPNRGRTWRETDMPIDAGIVLALAVSEEGLALAGTETGRLFASRDQGRAWVEIAQGQFQGEIGALVAAGGCILAAGADGLLFSEDEGATWQPWNADLPEGAMILAIAAPEGLAPGANVWVGGDQGLAALDRAA